MKQAVFCTIAILLLAPIVQAQGQGTLYGTVFDEDGKPVPNLTLSILGPLGVIKVVTGTLGQYQVNGLLPGDYTVTIEDPAYKLTSEKRTHLTTGQQRLNLTVAPTEGRGSGVLLGVVRLPNGVPAPSIVLTVVGPSRTAQVTTGPEGEYRVEDLHPGEYEINVDSQSFVVRSNARAKVSTAETRLDMTLGLHESVAVTAEAVEPTTVTSPGMSTVIVEHKQIEDRQPSTVDLILREIPGLAVSRQGGVGSPSAVYIRGGASNYALVLIDGFPVNDPGGEFDFGKLLPLELDRVEVTRGASSSIHGGALSGVVHMTTRQAATDEKKLYVKGEAGSFSWNRIQGGTSGRGDTHDWNIGAIHLQTDNQEPNSAFSQLGVAASAGVDMGEDTSVRFILRGETNEGGAPGQTAYIRPDLDAGEEQSRLVVGGTMNHLNGTTDHQFRVGLSKTNKLSLNPEDSGPIDLEPEEGELQFRIPDFSSADGIVNNTQRMTLAYKAEHPTQRHLITAGGELENQKGELGSDTATSTEIPEGAPPFLRRFQQSGLSYPTRTNLAGFLQDRIIIRNSILLTLGGRLEKNGSFGTFALPRAALAWNLGHTTTIKASGGIGLKEPSLEQSYGGNFRVQGNPDLKPERSRTFDAGIVQSFWGDRLFIEATVFHHMYQDQIALGNLEVPTFDSVFGDMTLEERQQIRAEVRAGLRERPQLDIDFDQFRPSYTNIGRTRAQGAELSFGTSPFLGTQLRADYTFLEGLVLESSDRGLEEGSALPNRPRHQFVFNGQSEIGHVTFGGTVLYVGERLADVDFVSRALGITTLEAYTRVDVRGQVRINPRFEVFAVSENLLDAEYMEVLGYPALGRSIRAGLRLDLGF